MENPVWIGVDPGKQGGVAMLSNGDVRLVPMPVLASGRGAKKTYDAGAISQLLTGIVPPVFVLIETQQAYPQQGSVSNFSTGYGFGLWLGLLAGMGIPHETVTPKRWQKHFGISGRDGDTKKQGIVIVKRLYPGVSLLATERSRKDHDGLSDALLIATYAARGGVREYAVGVDVQEGE